MRRSVPQRVLKTVALQREPGTAEPTFGRRSFSWDWRFEPTFPSSDRETEVVSFAPRTEAQLKDLAEIEGLYWEDKLVAFYDPVAKTVIPSQKFGVRGWVSTALGAFCMAGGAWLAVLIALRKRRSALSWWARPPAEPLSVLMSERAAIAPTLLLAGPGAAVTALLFGASVPVALTIGAGLAALLLLAQLRR